MHVCLSSSMPAVSCLWNHSSHGSQTSRHVILPLSLMLAKEGEKKVLNWQAERDVLRATGNPKLSSQMPKQKENGVCLFLLQSIPTCFKQRN